MTGKRKRADTMEVGGVEDGQVNGSGHMNHQENFQEWLADVLEILRE